MRMQPASRLPNLAKGHGHGYGPRWDMENNLKVLVGKRQSKGWGSELVAGGWCCLREGQSSERSKDRKCKNCENSSTYYCNDKGGAPVGILANLLVEVTRMVLLANTPLVTNQPYKSLPLPLLHTNTLLHYFFSLASPKTCSRSVWPE
jgi:hypothetical protein